VHVAHRVLLGLALCSAAAGSDLAGTSREPAESKSSETAPSVQSLLDAAVELIREGRSRAAMAALDQAERLEPQNPWLWFYRGLAEHNLGNVCSAMESFDRATDLLAEFGNPDPPLTEAIGRHRREARRQVLRLDYQVGLAYDTNVSFLGSTGSTLGITSGRRDGKFGQMVDVHYSPVTRRDELLTIGGRLGHVWNFSVEEFNYQDYGACVRYARMLAERWELSLQYDYDINLLGNESFLSNHALTPGLRYHWQPTNSPVWLNETGVFYQLNGQEFLYPTEPEYDRDGLVHSVGVEQSLKYHPLPRTQRTGDLSLGYRLDGVATEGREFDRTDHNFYLGASLPLLNPLSPNDYLILPDKELILRFNVNWQLGDYRHWSLLDRYSRRRDDQITTYAFTVSQKILDHPDWGELTLHGMINWTDARSNLLTSDWAEPYTYDKVVYGAQLQWTW